MPKISVIVPVYNVEGYIRQCLDSILVQTLSDLEIICIDDGSTDQSGTILDEIAAKDSRVKVIHKKNAGYGVAMNTGLAIAEGEYIGIVESDDYILPAMYEMLYNAAIKNDLDMVKADAFYWISSEEFLSRIHMKAMEAHYDRVLDYLDRNYFFEFYMNIWTGIYKKSFLDEYKIRFHESSGASYQDNGFWLLTCIYAQKAMWLNKAFYYYRQDNPMASVRSNEKMLAMTREFEYVEKVLRENDDEKYLPYCYLWRLIRNVGTYMRIADDKKLEFTQQIKKDFIKYSPYIQKYTYLNNYFLPLIKEPIETIRKDVEKKNNLIKKMNTASEIVIYGAGKYSERTFRILYNEGLSRKIVGFAVSGKVQKKSMINRKVMEITEALEVYKMALFIIAVTPNTNSYNEIKNTINELQISNYISGHELAELFYLV